MRLYSYWRSSTSYRVRAALNLKGIEYETVPVDLLAGEQKGRAYLEINPGAGVPALELEDGYVLVQSLAILEYLDVIEPTPPLLPEEPRQRARVRSVAQVIALDVHPVNNTRVISHLKEQFGASQPDCEVWMRYWMAKGFEAVEKMLPRGDTFAFSETPGLADLCIVAQAYNAHRWGLDLGAYPSITRIEQACLADPAIMAAHPDNQPEAKLA